LKNPELDPDPDPLARGTDLEIRIQIRTKMSRIPNTGKKKGICVRSEKEEKQLDEKDNRYIFKN
jgi:hypothetical protein